MADIRKKRSEIDNKYKWDLSKMYKSKKAWKDDIEKIKPLLKELISYKGKIMKNSRNLLEVLVRSDELSRLKENLYAYAHMYYYEDTTNHEALEMTGKIDKVVTELDEQTVFITVEILKSDYDVVKKYIKELESLKEYQFVLEKLFRVKNHVLNDGEESILAAANELLSTSEKVYDVMKDTDLKYGKVIIDKEKIEIAESNYVKMLRHKKQNIRKKVFETYYQVYDNFKNTFATTLNYNVKALAFVSKVRKYDNPLQMTLYQNNIDVSVYTNLIKVVNEHLDVMYKYVKLRKEELKVNKLHMYDIYAEMVLDNDKEYTYEEAVSIVKEALKPLGEAYLNDLNNAFTQKWIDVYDNVGKRNGAYSWGTYDSLPYLSMGFNKTLDNIHTLAHELGHSMHSYYTNHHQPYTYSGHAIFTAEVASTVNEMLLAKYLVNTTNDVKEKKAILNEMFDRFKGTLYRQTMFAEFEKILFEKEANNEVLTEKLISEIYYDLNKKYYGEAIIHDEQIRFEWMRIPHFYRPFYVYQYATGISAACAIATDILNGKKDAVENYLKFLKSGSSDYPINLLKMAGVDMTKTDPIEKAIKMFDEALDEYINLDK